MNRFRKNFEIGKTKIFFFILSKEVLLVMGIIMFTHLFLLQKYINQHIEFRDYQSVNHFIQHIEFRDYQSIDRLMTNLSQLIIAASKSMPEREFQTNIASLSGISFDLVPYKGTLSFSAKPKFDFQFSENDDWKKIKDKLLKANRHINFSYQISSNHWLNIEVISFSNLYNWADNLLIVELAVIALIGFYGWSVMRFKIPLSTFKQSAERLGIDINTNPIEDLEGPSIIRETAMTMNKMQNRIQELLNNRTIMLAAISHDLRTPITRLKLRAQFIEDDQAHKIIADLNEMDAMIMSILSFSREDVINEKKKVVDINALLTSICEDYIDEGQSVHCDIVESHIPFFGAPIALKRAFINIINNALKYADTAWIKLNFSADKITIVIEDDGPGIPEPEMPRVFHPYYRIEERIEMHSTGTGLGLTIANEVIKAHGGSIALNNHPNGGLVVEIILPNEYQQNIHVKLNEPVEASLN